MEYVEIDLTFVTSTNLSLKLHDGDNAEWIPLTTIKDPPHRWYDYDRGETYTFEIAEWKLKDVGFI